MNAPFNALYFRHERAEQLCSTDWLSSSIYSAINQSINAEFVGRRYTTRPGAPAESVKSTIKKYILESF